MPKFISAPIENKWSVKATCKGRAGCGYTYEYYVADVRKDTFKVSGYDFNDTADWQMKAFVYCGNCKREIVLNSVPQVVINNAPREKGFGK